jgi:tetratricopeptide (TPR) repeat protein
MKPFILLAVVLLISCLGFAQGAPTSVSKDQLSKLEATYKQSKAAFEKKPKDPKLKRAYVAATVKFGNGSMYSELPIRVKYRQALKLYREALKQDPKNKEALANKKMIEDIYTSMGRPIPN